MRSSWTTPALILSLAAGCATPPPPKVEAPPPPPPPQEVTTVTVEKPPEPGPEEIARAKAEAQLADERAKMQAQHQADLARFTPELRTQAQKLAEKHYHSAKAALSAVLASPTRKPENVERDKDRHPAQTLEFLGFDPKKTVLEVSPGEGWYTEILAPALAAQGKLICTSSDPNGPASERSTFYGERFKLFLETSPELYGKVQTVLIDNKNPKLDMAEKPDLVVLFRTLHGMVNQGTLKAWLAEIHKVLKPGGIVGVEQHRAAEGAVPEESAKQGYLPEKWVIQQFVDAGFKLVGSSEINANPKDTKDYPAGVWTLPPTYRLGDQDREKYKAIGESDRMTLKFSVAP